MSAASNMPISNVSRNASCVLVFALLAQGCARTVAPGALRPKPSALTSFDYARGPVDAVLETEMPESDAYASYTLSYPSRDQSEAKNRSTRAMLRVPHTPARGAVVILPILGGDYGASDFFACDLSEHGFTTIRYERKADPFEPEGGLDRSAHLMREAVVDIRRGLDWARSARVPGSHSFGVLGISMGSFVATLLSASDPRIAASVLALGGGDIVKVLEAARSEEEIETTLSSYEVKGIRGDALRSEIARTLGPLDPLAYAERLNPRTTLMVHARFDQVVPFDRGSEVWKAAGRPARAVLPTGHYGAVFAIPYLVPLVRNHFLRKL